MAGNGSTLKKTPMPLLEDIITQLEICLTRKGEVSIALSGGSSPIALYEAMSSHAMDWSCVTVTLIDDRRVPPDHQDSNQQLIRKTLLQHNARAATFIPLHDWPHHRIPDIAILGMGTDGHFASLFPAMMHDPAAFDPAASPAILTTEPMGNPLHPRITMNLAMILQIPYRVLMVIGAEKKLVLDNARTDADLPITRLLAHDGTVISLERI